MNEVKLGASGLSVGRLSYGCWRLAEGSADAALAKIRTALDCGMTLIDTADVYGAGETHFGAAEELLGEALRSDPGLRARMVLATKGGVDLRTPYRNDRAYLVEACEASLRRLGVERIDLYQVHRADLLAGVAEVAGALDGLIAAGKVAHVGVSNFTASHLRALAAHMKAPIVSVQNEFSVLEQAPLEDGVLDFCQETGAAFLAWSPLAGGRLLAPETERAQRVAARLDAIAADLGATRAQAALAFLMAHPAGIIPIIGTQQEARIRELARACEFRLAPRQWYDLVEAYRGARMP